MKMTIIYIILIIMLISILWHIFCHLMVVFNHNATDIYVKRVLKDPYRYVRTEEMCYFMRNMVYLGFVCMLLFAACNGNMKFENNTSSIEITDVGNK